MGDLVGVVADAAKLIEEGWVDCGVGRARAHIDLAFEHEALAQARYGQPEVASLRGPVIVVFIRQTNADHAVPRRLGVCTSSRHVFASSWLGSGRGAAP